jgi:hypothetical protein
MDDYLTEEQLKDITIQQFINDISSPEYMNRVTSARKDEETGYLYDDARVFLQGSCQLFALALNQIYGYSAYKISEGAPRHWFCKKTIEGTVYYIDVRGITTDFFVFKETLPYLNPSEDTSVVYNIAKEQPVEEIDKIGLDFALWIINNNKRFYDVNGCGFVI